MPTPSRQLISRTIYDTDGVTVNWDFSFRGGYLDRGHVKAYVDLPTGERTAITITPGMFTGPYQLAITPAILAGRTLTIYRDTPKDTPLVDFTDGAGFSEVSLDIMAKQSVFVSAESVDTLNTSSNYEAAVAADAARASQLAATASAAGASVSANSAAASAASINPANFATAAQGVKADTAIQPAGFTVAAISGATSLGRGLMAVVDAAAARALLGLSTFGSSLAQAADAVVARILLGAAESGANNDITSLTGLTSVVTAVRQIQPIGASVAGNALTISASALALEFRSATLTSGAVSFVEGTPANLVISSGSTLGTINATQSRIVVLALNNAGTIELAAVNLAGGNGLSETGLISTTAEGGAGAADSASVIYSATARSNVAYRVLGYIESTQATAGAWVTAPSTVQGQGGQALAAVSSLGYGQTWKDVTGSRANGTTYYNTTGKPIQVQVYWRRGANTNGYITLNSVVNGVTIDSQVRYFNTTDESVNTPCFVVPPGGSYYVAQSGLPGAMSWSELRP